DKGIFYVSVDFMPQNYDKVLKKIKTELNNFKNKPVDNKRLQLIKNSIKRQYEYANESVAGIANMLGYDVAVGNGLKDYCDYIPTIESITPEFINQTMQKYFKDENLALSVLLPQKNAKISSKNNIVNVSNKTKVKAKLVSQNRGIKKYKLNNGATLLLQKNTDSNVIATKIFLKGGSLSEEKDGTALILTDTIMKGTKNKSGKEVEDYLDNIGTNISFSNDYEYFEVSMKTTKDDMNGAFSILKEIIETPKFDNKDVKRAKEDALNEIKSAKDKPQNIAFENFYEAFYNNSPFLKTSKILEKSIPEITADDVKELHAKTFSAKNMIISVAGNFNENDLIEKFSSLNNSKDFKPIDDNILKAKLTPIEENVIKTESKKSKGAWLVQGWQTKGFAADDFAALKIISTYLGGGFTSKLFVDLRENKGLAYETGASSSSKFNSGMFFMYIGTNPENIETVKQDFEKEINDLKTKPISEKELCDLKNMITGRLKLATETNMAKAELNGYYEFFDKGYKFGYDYPELIEKVSVKDIMDVSNKYFSQAYIMSIVAENKYIK
ncbi:MAG: insulinase family protein, partial [Candidatus Gastranaerophilales bacterium]|nr:insulinase family protein [Candidatus Gastranaerophilales bacterium]